VADENRIKHVLFKLLSNAIKFTKHGGDITIGTEEFENNQIKIWVEDTGVGISTKDKKKVFEHFFKTISVQLMQKSGAGLGLSRSKIGIKRG
jgi:signal transduction histidine kinase